MTFRTFAADFTLRDGSSADKFVLQAATRFYVNIS